MIEEIKRVLGPRVPWAFFIREKDFPQLSPLLYDYVKKSGLENILSGPALNGLRSAYNDTLACNILLMEELRKVLRAFRQAKVRAMLMKGAALISEVYRNPALRPMTDIDLMVRPQDFVIAKETLNGLGYEDVSRGPEDFVKIVNGKIVDIDVHTGFVNVTRIPSRADAFMVDYDDLWDRALGVEVDGEPALILSAEDCLLDLSVHVVLHHGMDGLLWFMDITQILERYGDIDWNKVTQRAQKYRISKFLYLVLRYVKEIFSSGIPPKVIDGTYCPLGLMERKIFHDALHGKFHACNKFIFALCSAGSIPEKIKLLRQFLLPRPSVLQDKYRMRGILPVYAAHFKNIINGLVR
jgi:hypothetical protein